MENMWNAIVDTVIVVIIGIIGFFTKRVFKEYDKRLEKMEYKIESQSKEHMEDIENIKDYFLLKFEKVYEMQNSNKGEIIEAISQIRIEIAKQEERWNTIESIYKKQKGV